MRLLERLEKPAVLIATIVIPCIIGWNGYKARSDSFNYDMLRLQIDSSAKLMGSVDTNLSQIPTLIDNAAASSQLLAAMIQSYWLQHRDNPSDISALTSVQSQLATKFQADITVFSDAQRGIYEKVAQFLLVVEPGPGMILTSALPKYPSFQEFDLNTNFNHALQAFSQNDADGVHRAVNAFNRAPEIARLQKAELATQTAKWSEAEVKFMCVTYDAEDKERRITHLPDQCNAKRQPGS